jgi:cation transport ATPase
MPLFLNNNTHKRAILLIYSTTMFTMMTKQQKQQHCHHHHTASIHMRPFGRHCMRNSSRSSNTSLPTQQRWLHRIAFTTTTTATNASSPFFLIRFYHSNKHVTPQMTIHPSQQSNYEGQQKKTATATHHTGFRGRIVTCIQARVHDMSFLALVAICGMTVGLLVVLFIILAEILPDIIPFVPLVFIGFIASVWVALAFILSPFLPKRLTETTKQTLEEKMSKKMKNTSTDLGNHTASTSSHHSHSQPLLMTSTTSNITNNNIPPQTAISPTLTSPAATAAH